MTDPLDRRGQRAAQAVRAGTDGIEPDRGIDAVMRRGRRPRTTTVLAAVIVILGISVPAIGLLRDSAPTELEFTDQPPAAPADPDDADEADDPADVAEPDETAEPDDADEAPAPTPTETAEPDDATDPEPTPAAEEGPSPIAGFDTGPVSGELGSGDDVAFLTDVRVGSHDDFDRIVLEFEDGGASDFEVGYREPPIVSAGEGAEVDIDGEAFLELRLLSATGVDFERGDPYMRTYDGPDRIAGDTSVVTEVVQTGDFEATLSWVVGVRTDVPFAVSVLEGPLRLVVDVQSQ